VVCQFQDSAILLAGKISQCLSNRNLDWYPETAWKFLRRQKNRFRASAGQATRSLATVPNTLYRLARTWKKTHQISLTNIFVFALKIDIKINIKSGAN
jgi:hypothetical protein